MIDEETRKALETHLVVQLAIVPRVHLRAIAAAHGGDEGRRIVARRLLNSMAGPFNISPSGLRAEAPTTPGPTDGRKSWADKL